MVEEVFPRKIQLVRPPIANIDQAVLTFSAKEPDFNRKLLDRMLVQVERVGLSAVIIVTKSDLLSDASAVDLWLQPYRDMGYQTAVVSTENGAGLEQVLELLRGKLSGLSGTPALANRPCLTRSYQV